MTLKLIWEAFKDWALHVQYFYCPQFLQTETGQFFNHDSLTNTWLPTKCVKKRSYTGNLTVMTDLQEVQGASLIWCSYSSSINNSVLVSSVCLVRELPCDLQTPWSVLHTCSKPGAETSHMCGYIQIDFCSASISPRRNMQNLIIEPVLICQRRQVIQGQSVFPVDHPEGGNGFLNDRASVFVNF